MRICLTIILIICFSVDVYSQDSLFFLSPSTHYNKTKFYEVTAVQTAGYGSSLVLLSSAWYKNYNRTSFHFFDDSGEWLQMDKAGHFTTSWYIGRMGIDMMEWSGVRHPKAIWLGVVGGFAYLTGIECLDGFSDGWGFSWSDLSANLLGTGLIAGQKFLSRQDSHSSLKRGAGGISLKYSFHQTSYPSMRSELLGKNLSEQMLKDYNGQTYWLSFNLSSFMKEESKFPRWLNVSAGYGGEGMISGNDEWVTIDNGLVIHPERYRQYFFSFDIDLTRIRTRSKFLKTLTETFCFIKFPAPALEVSKKGLSFHPLYY